MRHEAFALTHAHGTTPLAPLADASPALLALLGGSEIEGVTVDALLFLDIETTGLGGAGAMVFLVTTAWLTDGHLQLRQYLAGSPADEAALLNRLVADIRASHDDPVLVTYNGRAFDAPMLDQRATMHRLRGAFEAMPHLDLLAPVRRGFRGVLPSCRLAVIEERFLGVTRPAHEVSGADVPTWYFRYLRTQDARHLIPLVTHNADDVLSLAALVARFAALDAGDNGSGLEHLALGRLHAAVGNVEAATRHLEEALTRLAPLSLATSACSHSPRSIARDECLLALATIHRRAGDTHRALPLWHEVAARPGALAARVLVEIAKHLEHVERDYPGALTHIERAIEAARPTAALLRRRDRLARKAASAPLPHHD